MPHRSFFAATCGMVALALAGCGSTRDHALISGHACLGRLSDHDIAYRSIDINDPSDSHCHIDTAVRVSRIHAALNRPATMSCALADRLDEFEREVVQPLAIEVRVWTSGIVPLTVSSIAVERLSAPASKDLEQLRSAAE